MNTFYFSIIIVVLNGYEKINRTITSVLNQSCRDYEIVVKDGNSTDGTLQCIPFDEKIRVVSKPDNGIYDGMNQALEFVQGKYLLFLNCGDVLFDKEVLKRVKEYSQDNDKDVIYGDYYSNKNIFKQPSKLKYFDLVRKPLCHQSMFFCKRNFDEIGVYNTKYRICSDYEFTIKLYNNNKKFEHINTIICDYEGGGISETNAKLLNKENVIIQKENFNLFYRILYGVYKILTLTKLRKWIVNETGTPFLRNSYYKCKNIFRI